MKDMVETTPLLNGAPENVCLAAKTSVNGEVMSQTNGAVPSSPGTSSCSSDLQLHLPADSDDECTGSQDMENFSAPKPNEHSSPETNFDVHNVSASNHIETIECPNKEADKCKLEGLLSSKPNPVSHESTFADTNIGISRTVSKLEESPESKTMNVIDDIGIHVKATLHHCGSNNSSDLNESKMAVINTYPVTKDKLHVDQELVANTKETYKTTDNEISMNSCKDSSKGSKITNTVHLGICHEGDANCIDLKASCASNVSNEVVTHNINNSSKPSTNTHRNESFSSNTVTRETVLDDHSSYEVVNSSVSKELPFQDDNENNKETSICNDANLPVSKNSDKIIESDGKHCISHAVNVDDKLVKQVTKEMPQESNINCEINHSNIASAKKECNHSCSGSEIPMHNVDTSKLKLGLKFSNESKEKEISMCLKYNEADSDSSQNTSVTSQTATSNKNLSQEMHSEESVRSVSGTISSPTLVMGKEQQINLLGCNEKSAVNVLSEEKNDSSIKTESVDTKLLLKDNQIEGNSSCNQSISVCKQAEIIPETDQETNIASGKESENVHKVKNEIETEFKDKIPVEPAMQVETVTGEKSVIDENCSLLTGTEDHCALSCKKIECTICTSKLVLKHGISDTSNQFEVNSPANNSNENGNNDEKLQIITEMDCVSDLNKDSCKIVEKVDTTMDVKESHDNSPIEIDDLKMHTMVMETDDSIANLVTKLEKSKHPITLSNESNSMPISTCKSDSSCKLNETNRNTNTSGKMATVTSNGTQGYDNSTSTHSTSYTNSSVESEAKENVSIADLQKMSIVNMASHDGSSEITRSSEKDVIRGMSGTGQKRLPTVDSPVESKRIKVDDSHENATTKELKIKNFTSISSSEQSTSPKLKIQCVDSLPVYSENSSENSCENSSENLTKLGENSSSDNSSISAQSIRKPLSNIDKAIERVAFAGLDRKERVMMPFIKDLKNGILQDVTIDDLEELVTQRMTEVLSDSGENGVLREKVQKLERMTEFWKNKAASLQKQLSDMTMVFKKLATETKQNPNQMQIPIKITRSVGLQVMMPQTQSASKSSSTQVRNSFPCGAKRKSGIMTNRNTSPNVQYMPPIAVAPSRAPVVQKVIAPPIPTSTPVKAPQAITTVKSPIVGSAAPAVRYRSPSSVVTTETTPASTNARSSSSITNRPVGKHVMPHATGDMLIDLTDEDDKMKRAVPSSAALPTTLRLAQLNGSPTTQGGTIHIVSPQHLTNPSTGVNGQRLAYMLPASAANTAGGRLQLFTQQTGGGLRPGSVLAVRPNTQTLTLKNGTVLSSSAPPSAIIRTSSGGTFQQVVPRQTHMRNLQSSNRLANGQISRNSGVLADQPVSRPLVAVQSGHPQHPAPLPAPPAELQSNPNWKKSPPRPDLKISKADNRDQHGIILSWNMEHGPEHEEIASYQLYAYQENSGPPLTSLWKKVGDVKAMPLPMACTLTQFLEGNKYHFAVRAVDIHSRCGMFSMPGHIILPRRVAS